MMGIQCNLLKGSAYSKKMGSIVVSFLLGNVLTFNWINISLNIKPISMKRSYILKISI
jgi:hypothetical protein